MSIHLKELKHGDLGEATIIVGDPGRVSLLAEAFDKRSIIVNNREFLLMNGYYKNQKVSVCSTGIGVGSTEICVSELLENGAKQIVRCGGCGAWRDDIEPGDIILNTGMARTTGLMTTYVPDTYPAVADSLLVSRIAKHLSGSKIPRIRIGTDGRNILHRAGKGYFNKGKSTSCSQYD